MAEIPIENSNAYTIINGSNNNNVINNYGKGVTIYTGAGNDTIDNFANLVMINAGAGDDSIKNANDCEVSINAGSGNDEIINYGGLAEIKGDTGNDTIYGHNNTTPGHGNIYLYDNGDGYDVIYNYGLADTVSFTSGYYSKATVGNDVILSAHADSRSSANGAITLVGAVGKTINVSGNEIRDINIFSSDSNIMINGTSGNDTLYIRGTNVTVDGGAGDDYFNSSIKYSILKGNSGNDLMKFAAENSVIDGGDGDDNISANMTATVDATTYENFRNTLIGGAGNDYITNFGEYASIDGGKGNDMVSVDFSANNNLFKYNAGDGNDTIIGFDSNDTLDIVGAEFSATGNGSDMLISVKGSGTITLKNTSSLIVDGLTWRIIGTTAEYGTLSNTLITLKGLKNGTKESDLSLSGNVVTLKPSALGTSNVSVTGNYTLALDGVSAPSTTSAHWNISMAQQNTIQQVILQVIL